MKDEGAAKQQQESMESSEQKESRFGLWTAIVALVAGCVGLSETSLELFNSSRSNPPAQPVGTHEQFVYGEQVVHIYHHAPFWENLVVELLEKSSAFEAAAGDTIDAPNPATPPKSTAPKRSASPHRKISEVDSHSFSYPSWMPGMMLAVILVSTVYLFHRKAPRD